MSVLLTILGPELVTNGGFDTDSDWTKSTNWVIALGEAIGHTDTGDILTQAGVELVSHSGYQVSFRVPQYTSGSVAPILGGVSGSDRSSSGLFTETITTGETGGVAGLVFNTSDAFTGAIDDVSVKAAVTGYSYATVAEANAYFGSRFGYDKWAAVTNKEAVLISAAQQLDLLCEWYGLPVSDTQPLAFPRTPDADPVPQAIKDAQCEIAYTMVDQGSASSTTDDALTEMKAGSVTLKFDARTPSNPFKSDTVTRLITDYGLCGGSGSTRIIPVGRS